MEGSDYLILRLGLCLLVFLGAGCAQEDFVSIRCCAEANFTDTETKINWKPDKSWFADRTGCRNISRPTPNYNGYDKARTFNIDSGKICYNLSTVKDQDYLIRGSFLFGDLLEASFGVTIGVTKISSVSSAGDLVVEGIFRAVDREIDFCLVKGKGSPYISELELRPLNDSSYLNNQSSTALKVVHRVSVGSSTDTRYPVDLNDRIWKPPPNLDPTAVHIQQNASQPIPYVNNSSQTIPFQFLQTALTNPDRLDFTHVDLDNGDHNYTVFLYFLELNSSVTRGERIFNICINNFTKMENFDVLDGGSNYRKVALSATAKGSLNLTLIKATNGSGLGPFLNAYEILQVRKTDPETNQEDVKLMKEVKEGLLASNPDNVVLQSWSGDPCGLVSWEGVACGSVDHIVSIINLNITSKNLTGPIPASITKLSNLKNLNLSHNHFTGNIPPFPASSMLISVDLSHNDFTGMLPESLINLRQLRALYYGCNPNLTKQDHPLDRPKVTTDNGACGGEKEPKKTSSVHGLIVGAAICVSFLFMVAAGVFGVCFYRKKMGRTRFKQKGYPITKNAIFSIPSNEDVVVKPINIQAYTLDYIEAVTQTYKTMIGEGGFGSVYRGTLRDGQEVAVKVRSATSTQGTREFNNELDLLSAIRHENLVPLLGFCNENDQQMLVYPFMSNGSLQDRLNGDASKRKILDWPTRLSIALGAARGLTYLHSFAGRCIIHRDVKSSNILLDNSMCAKVADFGFSKYAPQEGDSCASLEVRGTAGYLDPEYYSTQHLSAKSDVFSFGVVLLEIISGREPLNIHRPRNEWSLVEWAKSFIRESQIDEIVDPNIKGGYHTEAVWRVVEVAMACIEPFSAYRPCMADIVRELEDALIIENNASEYMKSIDSFGGSNRFSIVLEKKSVLPPTQHSSPSEPSPLNVQPLAPPDPR